LLVNDIIPQSLLIIAENFTTNHPYVRQVWLNDVPLDRSWIRYAEIEAGGILRFLMNSESSANDLKQE